MCKQATEGSSVSHELLAALPKCEHHIHIEGSLLPATLFELATRNKIDLPPALNTDDPSLSPSEQPIFPVNAAAYQDVNSLAAQYKKFTGLNDFLAYFYRGMAVLQSKSDFEDLAWAYFQKAHDDGVRHAEISFDPQVHIARKISLETAVSGFVAAQRRAEAELGMSTLLIACFNRHLPQENALELLDSAEFKEAVARHEITGIGLDSSEVGFPAELFVDVYKRAHNMGLRCTAHAGEEGPVENIAKSITAAPEGLGCERIDHGIRLYEDDRVVKQVVAQKVMLTVCPLSNVALHCADGVDELPIRKMLPSNNAQGEAVSFSINSDDPAYLGGFVLESYCAVQEAFDLSAAEWRWICLQAIQGSWCGDDRKAELTAMLDKVVKP